MGRFFEIDGLNADDSTKMYSDKINFVMILMHLLKELINTNWNLSLNLG